MRPSTKFFHRLSMRRRFAPSPVAPLPERTEFDEWLTSELDRLRIENGCTHSSNYMSCEWVSRAMMVAIETQRRAVEAINNGARRTRERGVLVDGYLDEVIELLDACNGIRETAESTTRRYADSVRSISRCFGREHVTPNAVSRAQAMLASLEQQPRGDSNGLSRRRRIGENGGESVELEAALSASISTARLALRSLSAGLSFKPNRRVIRDKVSRGSGSWVTALDELGEEVKAEVEKRRTSCRPLLNEFSHVATAARTIGKLLPRRPENDDGRRECLRVTVETLRGRCDELERGIRNLESALNELYRGLISVRVALLGIIR